MRAFKDRMGRDLSGGEVHEKIINRLYNYIADFALFWLHLMCFVPSHHLRRFTLRIAGMKIGSGSSIHMGCHFFSPKRVQIGNDTVIGSRAFLDGRAPIVIGNHVDIASEVMIYNSEHDVNAEDFRARKETVQVGDYVFIGPRVIILPGVKIGKGAVVAAGAVVEVGSMAGAVVWAVDMACIVEAEVCKQASGERSSNLREKRYTLQLSLEQRIAVAPQLLQ